MNIRPIRNNNISFLMNKRVLNKHGRTKRNMVYIPNDNNQPFPKKWTDVIIIMDNKGDEENGGEEAKGLGRG